MRKKRGSGGCLAALHTLGTKATQLCVLSWHCGGGSMRGVLLFCRQRLGSGRSVDLTERVFGERKVVTPRSLALPWLPCTCPRMPAPLQAGEEGVGAGPDGYDPDVSGTAGSSILSGPLKPDASVPVPKGFTKSIERLRSGQRARAELAQWQDRLSRGFVEPKVQTHMCITLPPPSMIHPFLL
jgi:hypothetical protein